MSKKRLAALGASAASAALVGSALFAPTAVADGPHSPSAFGIAADGVIDLQPTPYVEDDDEDTTIDIPAEELAGSGTLTAAAHPGEASAEVEDLSLLGVDVPEIPGLPSYSGGLIDADAVTATCDADDGVSSQIANLEIAGQEIPIEAGDNTAPIPGPLDEIVDIVVNQQLDNGDGSMTANALKITLLDGAEDIPGLSGLAGQTITVASATCDVNDDDDNGDGDGDNGDGDGDGDNGDGNNDDNNGDDNDGDGDGNGDNGGGAAPNDDGSAPQPEPQPGHVAVTG